MAAQRYIRSELRRVFPRGERDDGAYATFKTKCPRLRRDNTAWLYCFLSRALGRNLFRIYVAWHWTGRI